MPMIERMDANKKRGLMASFFLIIYSESFPIPIPLLENGALSTELLLNECLSSDSFLIPVHRVIEIGNSECFTCNWTGGGGRR